MSSSVFHIQATPADDGNLREGCGAGSGYGSGDDADDSDEGSDLNGDAVHPSAHDLNWDPVRPPTASGSGPHQRGRKRRTLRLCNSCGEFAYIAKGKCSNRKGILGRRRKSKGKQRRGCGP